MPYSTIGELPEGTKGLPAHGKEIYMKAFNAAFEQYKDRDNREALSHATAWAAVEKVYKKVGDKWVAKEGKVKESISDEDRKQLLQSALIASYQINQEAKPEPSGIVIEEVFDNEVIYSVDGQAYKMGYQFEEDGQVILEDPEKVVKQIIYNPMESLQAKFNDIIQEAGRRNATLDSGRIKKIMTLCQELLSSEAPDKEKANEAIKEADKTLAWLKEQAIIKTEEGVKFPAEAFAYVPDSEKPSGWQLRTWEDLDKKMTKAQLNKVSASLSPGGYKGLKATVPTSELAAAKRKIRAGYRKLGIEEDEMPRWVREAETREVVSNYVPLTEATFDKGRATVIVIKAGFNADKSRYYPSDMLQRDYGIFEGMKMYADHPTETEERELPERSIKNTGWVAVLKDVTCDDKGTVTGVAEIIESWLMTKLATLRDKELLSEMGISINAAGKATEATIEGERTLVIEKLTACRSVDFVTEPGASGIVTLYESDRNRDVDLVGLSALKERRPDLIKAITAEVREVTIKEAKKAMELEEQIKDKDTQIESLTKERDGLKEAADLAIKEKAKADAQAIVKEAVDKAELPQAAKERLIERFKDTESADGIVEAIKSEVDYIAKLSEAGKVKGLGETHTDPEKDHKALVESFKGMGMSDGEAEIAANGR